MALETPKPAEGTKEIPLTPKEKEIRQDIEFALSLRNYYTAATNALELAKTRLEYAETADSCASYLYHSQQRYSTAAEVYLELAKYYSNIGKRNKYEENMNYAASSYIKEAEQRLDSGSNREGVTEEAAIYFKRAFNIYKTLQNQGLMKIVSKKLEELGAPAKGGE